MQTESWLKKIFGKIKVFVAKYEFHIKMKRKHSKRRERKKSTKSRERQKEKRTKQLKVRQREQLNRWHPKYRREFTYGNAQDMLQIQNRFWHNSSHFSMANGHNTHSLELQCKHTPIHPVPLHRLSSIWRFALLFSDRNQSNTWKCRLEFDLNLFPSYFSTVNLMDFCDENV